MSMIDISALRKKIQADLEHIEYCSVHKPPAGYTVWKSKRGKYFWVTGNGKPPARFADAKPADDFTGKYTKPRLHRRDMDTIREIFGNGSIFDWKDEQSDEKPKLMHTLPSVDGTSAGSVVKDPAHSIVQPQEKPDEQQKSPTASSEAKPGIVAAPLAPQPSERSPSVPSANPNEMITQFFGKPPVS